MHRSRLQAIVIDCDNLEVGEAFWTRALGVEVHGRSAPYVGLQAPIPGLRVMLQGVREQKSVKSRIHLDLETDDLDAEVIRLESIGARRVSRIEDWYVMEDPCGNEFCVVPVSDQGFGGEAREWNVNGAEDTPAFSLSS